MVIGILVNKWDLLEKGKEASLVAAGDLLKQRAEVWLVVEEICPVGCCSLGGESKARAISSG